MSLNMSGLACCTILSLGLPAFKTAMLKVFRPLPFITARKRVAEGRIVDNVRTSKFCTLLRASPTKQITELLRGRAFDWLTSRDASEATR
jgi:hypothetical protein